MCVKSLFVVICYSRNRKLIQPPCEAFLHSQTTTDLLSDCTDLPILGIYII